MKQVAVNSIGSCLVRVLWLAFAQFGSDLDKVTQNRLARGQRTLKFLSEGQYAPVPVDEEVVVIFAVLEDLLMKYDVEKIGKFEVESCVSCALKRLPCWKRFAQRRRISDEMIAELEKRSMTSRRDFLA
jgi:F-type H+-transporting ATPase subunit alpha